MQINEEKFGQAVKSGDVGLMNNILLQEPSLDVNGTIEGEIDGECCCLPFILFAPDLDTIRLLLDRGANPNTCFFNLYDESGKEIRLLQRWCRERDESAAHAVTELLLQRGADPDLPEYDGRSYEFCLNSAVESRNIERVALLLKYGANPDIVCPDHDEVNETPLMRCLLRSRMDKIDFRIVELLLEHGAEATTFTLFENENHVREEESVTNFFLYKAGPLTKYDAKVVKLLLKRGACPYAMFQDQMTDRLQQRMDPFQEALNKDQFKIASLVLKARAADIEVRRVAVKSRKRKCRS